MATFTEDFARLRQDFDQSHQDRQEFVQNVRDEVAELREPFAADLRAGGEIFRGGHGTGHAFQFSSAKPKRTKKAGKG